MMLKYTNGKWGLSEIPNLFKLNINLISDH